MPRVGIVCGSQRVVRAGLQITHFVADIVQQQLDSLGETETETEPVDLDVIDIATLDLPLTDEPGMPSQITGAAGYAHERTRAWSRRAAALDAFVFVTPQYNWGVPAGLKNALDHLFHEWRGKPALVVSYGGHGGDKAAAALQLVLAGGLGMRVVAPPVCLAFPSRAVLAQAAQGADLGLSATRADSVWHDRQGDIVQAWGKLQELLRTP